MTGPTDQAGETSFDLRIGRGEDLQAVARPWCQPRVGHLEVELTHDGIANRPDSGVLDLRNRATIP